MGSSFVAVADDVNAVYYNPAGLGQLMYPQVMAGYGKMYLGIADGSDISNGHLAVGVPVREGRSGTLGFHTRMLRLTDAYQENVYGLSYGREILPALYAGAGLKWFRRSFVSDAYTDRDPLFQQRGRSASAVGLDAGFLYRYSRRYVLAFNARNMNAPDVGLGSDDRIAPIWEGGFAYDRHLYVMTASAVRQKTENGLRFGGERWFWKHRFAARGGLDLGSGRKRNLSTGAGFRAGEIQIDYAFLLPLSGIADASGAHRMTLTARFGRGDGKPLAEEEEEALLGPTPFSPEEVERMRDSLAHERQAAVEERQEAAVLRFRVQEMEGQIADLERAKAARRGAGTAATKAAGRPERAVARRMGKELTYLRGEVEKLKGRMAEAPDEAPPETGRLYTVVPGDVLPEVARKVWGDPDRWGEIFKANRDTIVKRGGELTPGQILRIP
jgi:hypothetical protein